VLRAYTKDDSLAEVTEYLADVWDGMKVLSVSYGGFQWNAANTSPDADVTVDATPDVRAAADAWCAVEARKRALERDDQEARKVLVGREVVVIHGRKIPWGTSGVCIWRGPNKYRRYGYRVGFKTESGQVYFTDLYNVVVHRPERYRMCDHAA
jgi:hypothetical protein